MGNITKTIIVAILAIIGVGALMLTAAIKNLSEYMKERDKNNESWIDPRNDRTY